MAKQTIVYRRGGLGFTSLLVCLLVGLKLGGVANISWLMIILTPFIVFGIGFLFALVLMIIAAILTCIGLK